MAVIPIWVKIAVGVVIVTESTLEQPLESVTVNL